MRTKFDFNKKDKLFTSFLNEALLKVFHRLFNHMIFTKQIFFSGSSLMASCSTLLYPIRQQFSRSPFTTNWRFVKFFHLRNTFDGKGKKRSIKWVTVIVWKDKLPTWGSFNHCSTNTWTTLRQKLLWLLFSNLTFMSLETFKCYDFESVRQGFLLGDANAIQMRLNLHER